MVKLNHSFRILAKYAVFIYQQKYNLSMKPVLTIFLIICLSIHMNKPQASEYSKDNDIRLYGSPEERREAGLGRQITNWLTVYSLLEAEKNFIEQNFANDEKDKIYDKPNLNFQLGFDVIISEWLSAELILDSNYDFEAKKMKISFRYYGMKRS